MKKLFALFLACALMLACMSAFADNTKVFNHSQLRYKDGYEYTSSDNTWKYSVYSYCLGQKSTQPLTDTHLVYIGLKANSNSQHPESADVFFMFMAMTATGQLESIDNVFLAFKVGNETYNIYSDSVGVITPDNKETLKLISEAKQIAGTIGLKNSSQYITFYLTAEEMAAVQEAAKALYHCNAPDYITKLGLERERKDPTLTIETVR